MFEYYSVEVVISASYHSQQPKNESGPKRTETCTTIGASRHIFGNELMRTSLQERVRAGIIRTRSRDMFFPPAGQPRALDFPSISPSCRGSLAAASDTSPTAQICHRTEGSRA